LFAGEGRGIQGRKKVYFFYKKLARTKKMFTFAARFNGIGFRPAEEGMILRGGMLTRASDCPIFFGEKNTSRVRPSLGANGRHRSLTLWHQEERK